VVSDVETAKKVNIIQNMPSDFDNFQITFLRNRFNVRNNTIIHNHEYKDT